MSMQGYMEIPPKGCVRKWAVWKCSDWEANKDPLEVADDFYDLIEKYQNREDVIFGRVWRKK